MLKMLFNSWKLQTRRWKCLEKDFSRFHALVCFIYALKLTYWCSILLFHLQILPSDPIFSFFALLFSCFCSKKHHFCFAKHFHGDGLRFQLLKFKSTAVDLISTLFLSYLITNCKKTDVIIFILTLAHKKRRSKLSQRGFWTTSFIFIYILLMLWAQQVIHCFHRIERADGHLYKNGVPITHGTIPQTGKLESFERSSTLRFRRDETSIFIDII